jgi:hypothetical protein
MATEIKRASLLYFVCDDRKALREEATMVVFASEMAER